MYGSSRGGDRGGSRGVSGRGGYGGGRGGYGGNRGGPRRSFGPREMHKAVCSECKQECEVPFKPSGDRPVYCKACFDKRRESEGMPARADKPKREEQEEKEEE